MKLHSILLITVSAFTLTACASTIDKVARTGKQPPLSKIENPQAKADYKPLSWPMPDPELSSTRTANSLWQPGSRAFFRDQRAARVGDILRINIEINDKAQLNNKTNRGRNSTENVAAPTLFGYEKKLKYLSPGNPETNVPMFDLTSDTSTTSDGKIDRKEKIRTQIAALVTQVLPNGNLVIEGSQEILVNYEIREVAINGVIRPQDINSDNTIESNQIAQARITYSGRGQISDVQQPRWGQQLIEVLSPF